jgi:hypothetical protein
MILFLSVMYEILEPWHPHQPCESFSRELLTISRSRPEDLEDRDMAAAEMIGMTILVMA